MAEEDKNGPAGIEGEAETRVFSIPEPAQTYSIEPETLTALYKLALIFERMNLGEYLAYLKTPYRMIWINFLVGLTRGLGIAMGMSVLFALVLYSFSHMVDLPLIGKFIAKIVEIVTEEMKMQPSQGRFR